MQVGEPLVPVDLGKQIVYHAGRDAGIGHPERRVLERANRSIDTTVGAGGNRNPGEVGILLKEAAIFGVRCQIEQGNVVGLGRQDHGAAGEGGEQPEGIELPVAEGGSRIVVSHCVALDRIPHPHVGEEQLTVGESAGPGVPYADFPASQILDAPDARSLAHHQLRRRTVQVKHREHVLVLAAVVFQPALAPEVDMPGVDHPELHPASIDLAQVLQRTRRGLGFDGVVRGRLDRAEGLNGVGHDLEGTSRRPAAKHHALAGRGVGGQGDGEGQQRRATDQKDSTTDVHNVPEGPGRTTRPQPRRTNARHTIGEQWHWFHTTP